MEPTSVVANKGQVNLLPTFSNLCHYTPLDTPTNKHNNPLTMGGILKNKNETDPSASAAAVASTQSTKEFREQVLKNTKLNAKLKDFKPELFNAAGEVDMAKLNSLSTAEQEKLQWNSQNLSDNAEIQQKIIANMETSIDEPKTPFQHAAEMNEYYQPDEEEDLEAFTLGEPEIKVDELDEKFERPVHPEELDENDDDDQEEEQPQKKMTFDEMRKQHYHHETPNFHPVEKEDDDDADEDDDDEEEADQEKPKMSFAEKRKMHYQQEHVPAIPDIDAEDDE